MRGRVGPDFGPVPEREELDFPELDFAANKTGPEYVVLSLVLTEQLILPWELTSY
jgi:hypothetical protein